jgi:CheY-like chemotaxis protein
MEEIEGQDAFSLDSLAQSSFNLVLVEIRMPVMDGIETTLRMGLFFPQPSTLDPRPSG